MLKKLIFFILILFYSYPFEYNSYFYILEHDGIKNCFSDDCTNYAFETAKYISPFCKAVYVLSNKILLNPEGYLIKNNAYFDPYAKTYITTKDGYLIYCVDKKEVVLFLLFTLIYLIFVFFIFKCPCLKYTKNNILLSAIILILLYLLISIHFFKRVVLFYFDTYATQIFYIYLISALVLYTISKSQKLFFDRCFLYETLLIFITLEIVSITDLSVMILIILFLIVFSNQIQKWKLLFSGSKIENFEKENEIKRLFSKYCKIDHVYKIESDNPNAFATGFFKKDIYLTTELIKRLKKDELLAIIAHEIGHHYHNHILKVLIIILIPFLLIYFIEIPPHMKEVVFFVYSVFSIFLIKIIKTNFEKEADMFACKIIGKNHLISAIVKINSKEDYSIFHPTLKERLNNIFKC